MGGIGFVRSRLATRFSSRDPAGLEIRFAGYGTCETMPGERGDGRKAGARPDVDKRACSRPLPSPSSSSMERTCSNRRSLGWDRCVNSDNSSAPAAVRTMNIVPLISAATRGVSFRASRANSLRSLAPIASIARSFRRRRRDAGDAGTLPSSSGGRDGATGRGARIRSTSVKPPAASSRCVTAANLRVGTTSSGSRAPRSGTKCVYRLRAISRDARARRAVVAPRDRAPARREPRGRSARRRRAARGLHVPARRAREA